MDNEHVEPYHIESDKELRNENIKLTARNLREELFCILKDEHELDDQEIIDIFCQLLKEGEISLEYVGCELCVR